MRQLMRVSALGAICLLTDALAFCQAAPDVNEPAEIKTMNPAQEQSMTVGPGDVLSINASGSPDFTMRVRLDANGDVLLPYLGREHFGGITAEGIERIIEVQLKEKHYFLDPQVLVFVESYVNQTISVIGEVNKPGVFPGVGLHTIYQMLSAAGGLTQFASQDVFIYRRGQEHPVKVAVSTTLSSVDPSAEIPVYAGDTIRVPKSGLVYVVGAVKSPNAYPIPTGPGITLVQAISLAGGALRTAKEREIYIVRSVGDTKVDIAVNLGRVLSGKAADVTILANDIVFVPDSYAKIIGAGSAGVIGSAIYAAAYLGK